MAIRFEYGPPPSALGALAYEAGAAEAADKRRREIEQMQMQAAQMRQQQQQAAADRQFSAWKSQYSHYSAVDKMQKDFKWREGQAEQGREHQQKMFGMENDRRDFEWGQKKDHELKMWDINVVESRRKDREDHQQAIDLKQRQAKMDNNQQLGFESRQEQRKLDAVSESYLNPPGREALRKHKEKRAQLENDVRMKPPNLTPNQISQKEQLLAGMRKKEQAIYDNPDYRLDVENRPHAIYKKDGVYRQNDENGVEINSWQDPSMTKEEAEDMFGIRVWGFDLRKAPDYEPENLGDGRTGVPFVYKDWDEKTGKMVYRRGHTNVSQSSEEAKKSHSDYNSAYQKAIGTGTGGLWEKSGGPGATSGARVLNAYGKHVATRLKIDTTEPGWDEEGLVRRYVTEILGLPHPGGSGAPAARGAPDVGAAAPDGGLGTPVVDAEGNQMFDRFGKPMFEGGFDVSAGDTLNPWKRGAAEKQYEQQMQQPVSGVGRGVPYTGGDLGGVDPSSPAGLRQLRNKYSVANTAPSAMGPATVSPAKAAIMRNVIDKATHERATTGEITPETQAELEHALQADDSTNKAWKNK